MSTFQPGSRYRSWYERYPFLPDLTPPDLADPAPTDPVLLADRATALGHLSRIKALWMASEAAGERASRKEIDSMVAQALELKDLVGIRIRSMRSKGLLGKAEFRGDYAILSNNPADTEAGWAAVIDPAVTRESLCRAESGDSLPFSALLPPSL